jgi:hypothetical protein
MFNRSIRRAGVAATAGTPYGCISQPTAARQLVLVQLGRLVGPVRATGR